MISVHVKARADGRYDIWVHDKSVGGVFNAEGVFNLNGEVLLFSNQGYENALDAERIARRLFGPESADLVVSYRGGTTRYEVLR